MGLQPSRGTFVWRLSNFSDLSGKGGLIAGGRWHSRGRPIVYCSGTVDCAIREVQRHLDLPRMLFPDSYRILSVRIPINAAIEEISESDLPENWRDSYALTAPIGDVWLRSVSSPVLKVPSAICEDTSNYLLNPVHRMSDFIEVVSSRQVSDLP